MKKDAPSCLYLDGQAVNYISAFLFHEGSDDDPARLNANRNKSFQGNIILGMGFTFDDTDTKDVATPVAEMRRILTIDDRNSQIVHPYIGGKEVNSSPTQTPHRYVINFRDYPLRREALGSTWKDSNWNQRKAWLDIGIVPLDFPSPVAADWPDLLAIVEQKVKPSRLALPQTSSWNRDFARRWWQFAIYRVNLHKSIKALDLVLVLPRVSQHLVLTFLPSDIVFSDQLYVFSLTSFANFGILQSRIHEIWARFFGSTLGDGLRYANTDCFETFPFPRRSEGLTGIETAAMSYYKFRSSLMVQFDEGMTKIYNRFHDPNERSPDIVHLRNLHEAMDRATLDAYGWYDISTHCEFLLDYPVDETGSSNQGRSYRFRWPDDIRDEVLGRLLELNARQATE